MNSAPPNRDDILCRLCAILSSGKYGVWTNSSTFYSIICGADLMNGILLLFSQENPVDNIQRQHIGRINRLHSRVLHQWKPCLQQVNRFSKGLTVSIHSNTILQDPYDKIARCGKKYKHLQLQSTCGRYLPHYLVCLKFHHFLCPADE